MGTRSPRPAGQRTWGTALLLAFVVLAASSPGAEAKEEGKSSTSDPKSDPKSEQLAELWIEPTDLERRDLFWGPGGKASAPDPNAPYKFHELDRTGHSPGYYVDDPQGRRWKVKTGEETSAEMLVSRALWAIGYHQPIVHYLPRWKLTNGPTATPAPGRFRLESDHKKKGDWSWRDNPFVGTREMNGLMVANLVFSNWDLTPSNNRVYKPLEPGAGPKTWYVVQDVGGSMGRSKFPFGSRNKIADFEKEGLIRGIEEGRPEFEYASYHSGLLRDVSREDVVWACSLLARISESQWQDAFRAAGYPDDVALRYRRKIHERIQEGLALDTKGTAP